MPFDWNLPTSTYQGGILGPARGATAQALRRAGYDVDKYLAEEARKKRAPGFFQKYILGPLTYLPKLEAQLVTPTPGPWWKEFTEAAKPEAPTIGQVITQRMKPGWGRSLLATAADIGLDPTTYLGLYAAKGAAAAVRAAGAGAAERLIPVLATGGVSGFARGAAVKVATEAAVHGSRSKIVQALIKKGVGPALHAAEDAPFLQRMALEGEAVGRAVPKTAFGWGVGFGKYATIVPPETVQKIGLGWGQAVGKVPVLGALTKMATTHYVSPGAYTTPSLVQEFGERFFRDFEAFAKGRTETAVELAQQYLATHGITRRDYARVFASLSKNYTPEQRQLLMLLQHAKELPEEAKHTIATGFERKVREGLQRAAKRGFPMDEGKVALLKDRFKAGNFSPAEVVLATFPPELQADATQFVDDLFPALRQRSYETKALPSVTQQIEAEAATAGAALAKAKGVEAALSEIIREGRPLHVMKTLETGRKAPRWNLEALPSYKAVRAAGARAKDVRAVFKEARAAKLAAQVGEEVAPVAADIDALAARLQLRLPSKVLQDAAELSVLHDLPQVAAIARARGLPDTLDGLLQHIATMPIGEMREDGLIEELARAVMVEKAPGFHEFWIPGVRAGKAGQTARRGQASPAPHTLPKTWKHNPLAREHMADFYSLEAETYRAGGNYALAEAAEELAKDIRPERDIIDATFNDFWTTWSAQARREFTNQFAALGKTKKEVAGLPAVADWVKIGDKAWPEFKGLLFPKEARDAFAAVSNAFTSGGTDISAVAKLHGQFMGFWKTVTVAGLGAPRWVEGNFGGNIWLMFMGGLRSPVRLLQGIVASRIPPSVEALHGILGGARSTSLLGRAIDRAADGLARLVPDSIYAPALGRRIKLEELPNIWRDGGGMKTFSQGEFISDFLARGTMNPLSPQFYWTKGVMEFNTAGELAAHMGLFADRLAKGDSIRDAVATTRRFLMDYGDLTEWERKWGKGVVPFYCVDEETEALTKRGWLCWKDIREGDEVWTLNCQSKMAEWQAVQGLFSAPYSGEMVSIEQQGISALCTSDHRWPVTAQYHRAERPYVLKETASLNSSDHIPLAIRGDLPAQSWLTDDLAELLGWVLAEGHFKARGYTIEIAQSSVANPQKVEQIRHLLGSVGARYHEFNAGVGRCIHYFGITGTVAQVIRSLLPDKTLVPSLVAVMTKGQLEGIYRGLVGGDGSRAWDNDVYGSSDKSLADAFQMICALLGKPTYLRSRIWNSMFGRAEMFYVTVKHRRVAKVVNSKQVAQPYDGIVWCPKTVNGTWFARRNGRCYFTGNTWIRKNVGLHLRMLYEQPGKPGAIAKFIKDTDLNAPEYPMELKPSWMGDVGAIRGAQQGKPTYYLPQIPFLDISRVMSARQFSGSLHPGIGYFMKRVFDKDPYTGQPVSGRQAFLETLPWISTPARVLRLPPGSQKEAWEGLYKPVRPYRVDLVKGYQQLERERADALATLARQAEARGRMQPTRQRIAQRRRVSTRLQRAGISEEMME